MQCKAKETFSMRNVGIHEKNIYLKFYIITNVYLMCSTFF